MKLTKEGFVFLDDKHRAFKCCLIGKEYWLLRWHRYNKCWVTYRKVNQKEIDVYYDRLNKSAKEAVEIILKGYGIIA